MRESALKHVAALQYGDALPAEVRVAGPVRVFGSNGPTGTHNSANTQGPAIIIGRKGSFGKVTWADSPGFCIDTAYYIDSRHTKANLRWLYWALQTLGLDTVSEDTGVPGLSREKAYQAKIQFPPLATQTAIADFLDRKTAAIDTLIAKKEELITRLEQYRQSLITETVSRGLVAGAATRASGIAGMGAIPAHWRVAKTGQVLRYVKGKAVSKEDLALEGDTSQRFWRTGDFWNQNNREKDEVFVTDSTGLVWKDEGELVVCFDGFNSEVGKGTVGMARFEGEGFIDSMLALVKPKAGHCRKYLEYVHCAAFIEEAIVAAARGTTAMHAGYAQYDLQIPLPPLCEQEAIATFLDKKLASFYRVKAAAVAQIAMLKEYRASLISEAVTGKLALDPLQ